MSDEKDLSLREQRDRAIAERDEALELMEKVLALHPEARPSNPLRQLRQAAPYLHWEASSAGYRGELFGEHLVSVHYQAREGRSALIYTRGKPRRASPGVRFNNNNNVHLHSSSMDELCAELPKKLVELGCPPPPPPPPAAALEEAAVASRNSPGKAVFFAEYERVSWDVLEYTGKDLRDDDAEMWADKLRAQLIGEPGDVRQLLFLCWVLLGPCKVNTSCIVPDDDSGKMSWYLHIKDPALGEGQSVHGYCCGKLMRDSYIGLILALHDHLLEMRT